MVGLRARVTADEGTARAADGALIEVAISLHFNGRLVRAAGRAGRRCGRAARTIRRMRLIFVVLVTLVVLVVLVVTPATS